MKRTAILMVTAGLILVIVGVLLNYLTGSLNNKKNENIKNEILDSYKKFEETSQIITGERNIITSELVNHYFNEEVEDNYDNWITKLNEYENTVKEIDKYKNVIDDLCINKEYKDSKVKSACESMMIGYETSINYFVKDINNFNVFINDYNEENSENMKKEYGISYNYIDINDDGKYLGK